MCDGGINKMCGYALAPRKWDSCAVFVSHTLAAIILLVAQPATAAEFGTGPWVKGYTDIFGGVLPSQPGFYSRTDLYDYDGTAGTTIFDGRIAANVEEDYTATISALTYVTPWKILGGNYAVAVAPSMLAMDVNVGLQFPAFTGPRGRSFGPFDFNTGDSNLALGDTAFAPLVLGWNAGNFHWNFAFFGFAPTGDYSKTQLANTSLNHWAIMPRLAGTWFDPKTGWQINAAAIYSVNWENPATNYETGNILNLDGAITKNLGPFGVGAVAYAMIQTTGDSGSGARLGSFESRVYGVGPILTFTTSADPAKALTILIKGYHEFDAQHTFEGNVVDGAVSFKILDDATVDLARSCCNRSVAFAANVRSVEQCAFSLDSGVLKPTRRKTCPLPRTVSPSTTSMCTARPTDCCSSRFVLRLR